MSTLVELKAVAVEAAVAWADTNVHIFEDFSIHSWAGLQSTYYVSDTGVSLDRYWPPMILNTDTLQYRISDTMGGQVALSFGNIEFSPALFENMWPPPITMDFVLKYYNGFDVREITSGVLHLSSIRDAGISYEVYQREISDFLEERILYREDGDYTNAEAVPVPWILGDVKHQQPVRLPDFIDGGTPYDGPRFTDNADGTITDHVLGVMWLENPDDFTGIDNTPLNYADAKAFCEAMTFGGYNDWRLPTMEQLVRLGREDANKLNVWNASLVTDNFGSVQSAYYWGSADANASSEDKVVVDMGTGHAAYRWEQLERLVWPCRDVSGIGESGLLPDIYPVYWKAHIDGVCGTDWHLFDDGVNISTNVVFEDVDVFRLGWRPVGALTMSGSGVLRDLADVAGRVADIMELTVDTVFGRDPLPILGVYWNSQMPAHQVLNALCISQTHMFWIHEGELQLIDMFASTSDRYVDGYKIIDSDYSTNPAVTAFRTSWTNRVAVEVSAGRIVKDETETYQVLTGTAYGSEQSVETHQMDKDAIGVTLQKMVDVYQALAGNITVPLEADIPVPGERWLLIDRSLYKPLSVQLTVRSISYNLAEKKVTISGDSVMVDFEMPDDLVYILTLPETVEVESDIFISMDRSVEDDILGLPEDVIMESDELDSVTEPPLERAILTLTSPEIFYGVQQTEYDVTLSSDPVAGGTTNGAGTFDWNEDTTISAHVYIDPVDPQFGYFFMYWSENSVQISALRYYTFLLMRDRDLVAHFHPTNYVYGETIDLPDASIAKIQLLDSGGNLIIEY